MKNFKKEKVLIIRHPNVVLEKEYILARGYPVEEPYIYHTSMITRTIRKLLTKVESHLSNHFYNKSVLKYDVDTIIIFESLITKHYISWIKEMFPHSRVIIWYWNIAYNTINPNSIKNLGVELWSFSRKDCKTYDMRFNPGPYFSELKYKKEIPKYDISFVGKDKGRLEQLVRFEETFDRYGLKSKFVITPTNRMARSKHYSNTIPYQETLKISSRSIAVLDLIEINDSGQSLRIFESLFSNQKVITNSELIRDYEFYHPSNIYVIESEEFVGIDTFLREEFVKYDKSIIEKYDFENWVLRFFQKDQVLEEMMDSYLHRN